MIDTGTVTFPPIDVSGDVSFFMPFRMDLSGNLLKYATAQPLCRQGDTYFFVQIPGIAAEYQFEDGQTFTPEAGLESGFRVNGVNVITLTWEQAKYLRKLDGEIYVGEESDLYKAEGEIRSISEGSFGYWHWDGGGFAYNTVQKSFTEPFLSLEAVEHVPFEPKYAEELHIGGERKVTWQKMIVTGSQGFVNIDYYGDVAQIYADGELVADSYYYGEVWRVPAKLLEGKECYLAVSEIRDDFYREF